MARDLVLFDVSGTSHSDNALVGLARAARAAGYATTVVAPARARPDDGLPGVTWRTVEVAPDLNTLRKRLAHRRALRRAIRDAPPGALVCDLGLDRTLTSRGPAIPAGPDTVFVAHGTAPLDTHGPSTKDRRAARVNRRVLRALGTRGAGFVVHTEQARARLVADVPEARVAVTGWPVVSATDPCLAPDRATQRDPGTVLFAGSPRAEKNLDLLLDAIRDVPEIGRLVIPRAIPRWLLGGLDLSDPRVERWDRWLSPDEYRGVFETAALAVLPYTRGYTETGGISAVLLETLATGTPIVVSDSIAHLLPPGYEGAVVIEADSRDSLIAGLRRALRDRDALTAAASEQGRAHIREHHTYERYLEGVVGLTRDAARAG